MNHFSSFFLLDYQDSNLEKQDQNLLCYHYTIVQSFNRTTRSVFDAAKILLFIYTPNFSGIFLSINPKKLFKLPIFRIISIIPLVRFPQKSKKHERFHFLFFIHTIKPSIFVLCFLLKQNTFIVKSNKNERN